MGEIEDSRRRSRRLCREKTWKAKGRGVGKRFTREGGGDIQLGTNAGRFLVSITTVLKQLEPSLKAQLLGSVIYITYFRACFGMFLPNL